MIDGQQHRAARRPRPDAIVVPAICPGAAFAFVDAHRRPCAGAVVELRLDGLPQPVARAVADGRGVARFGPRPAGRYWLDAHHGCGGSLYSEAIEVTRRGWFAGAECDAVSTSRCDGIFELRCDGRVVARVHDGRRGIGGLGVYLRAAPDGPWVTTLRRTDDAGWLVVDGLPPGPLQLEVAGADWWGGPIAVEARSSEPDRVHVDGAAAGRFEGPRLKGGRDERPWCDSVRLVRRATLEFAVYGLDLRARTATRRRTRIDVRADGLGSLAEWLEEGLVGASTIDGLPDRRGRLRLEGVPATRLHWRVRRGRIERSGELRPRARSTVSLRVDLATRRRCLVPRRSATTGA